MWVVILSLLAVMNLFIAFFYTTNPTMMAFAGVVAGVCGAQAFTEAFILRPMYSLIEGYKDLTDIMQEIIDAMEDVEEIRETDEEPPYTPEVRRA